MQDDPERTSKETTTAFNAVQSVTYRHCKTLQQFEISQFQTYAIKKKN
jgi:hypothetical protein